MMSQCENCGTWVEDRFPVHIDDNGDNWYLCGDCMLHIDDIFPEFREEPDRYEQEDFAQSLHESRLDEAEDRYQRGLDQ